MPEFRIAVNGATRQKIIEWLSSWIDRTGPSFGVGRFRKNGMGPVEFSAVFLGKHFQLGESPVFLEKAFYGQIIGDINPEIEFLWEDRNLSGWIKYAFSELAQQHEVKVLYSEPENMLLKTGTGEESKAEEPGTREDKVFRFDCPELSDYDIEIAKDYLNNYQTAKYHREVRSQEDWIHKKGLGFSDRTLREILRKYKDCLKRKKAEK